MEPQDQNNPGKDKDDNWERDLLNRLAFASINEQRRTRRWNIFFRSMILLFVVMVFLTSLSTTRDGLERGKHTALIDIEGVIAATTEASADNIVTGLRNAYKDDNTAGIILRINSPGGSPVQAGYVNDEILRLREKHPDIPVYAVISDICASGGYYIAVAADRIYADKASMVGSIGVLFNGFGFVDAIDKLGVERRLITAGEHKGFLDPFQPMKEEDRQHLEKLLGNIHQQFIDVVRRGRGDKLQDNDKLFSGYVWTGEQGIEMGLVDELGSSSHVAREVIKQERIKDFTYQPTYFDRLADRIGNAMANTLSDSLGLRAPELR
jgi:protease-4